MHTRQKGFIAEKKACQWLIYKGFEIVQRNFFASIGEIDIIAKKNSILHFIEVKSGKNFNPIYAITPKKLKRIYKSIEIYFLNNPSNFDYCVDALIVQNDHFILIENISL